MRNLCLTLLLAVCFHTFVMGQERITWSHLADVTFKPVYNAIHDTNFLMPTFGDNIKSYKGKEVQIKGYFLNLNPGSDFFLLSANPMASCFFCGGSGPETIIEVKFVEKPPFRTDQVITVTGTLMLNKDDVDHCNYILVGATGELSQ